MKRFFGVAVYSLTKMAVYFVLCFAVLFSFVKVVLGDNTNEQNLVLNKKYTWNLVPDYELCVNDKDNEELTDGKHVPENVTSIWGDKACVGWGMPKVILVFDLEKVEPVEEVRFSTQYSEGNGIFLPDLVVGVSNDGLQFKQVADWSAKGKVEQKGLSRYTISLKDLKAVGRYVKIQINSPSYTFVDEVEILKGDFNPTTINLENLPDMDKKEAAAQIPQSAAGSVRKTDNRDIALGKKYTFNPEPTYSRDPEKVKLTDGKFFEGIGGMWTDKASVSWGVNNPEIEIVFDLEKVEPIDEVRFSTQSSPGNGLFLPGLVVGVSNDGVKFKQVAAWSPTGVIDQKAFSFYTISVKDFQAIGRYVKVFIHGIRGYLVPVDEIEILRGKFDPSSVAMDKFPEMSASTDDLRNVIAGATYTNRLKTLVADAQERLKDGRFPENLSAETAQLAADVKETLFPDRPVFDRLYLRYCAIQGKAANALFKTDFLLWQKNPWVGYYRHQLPESSQKWDQVLNASMMINEYESLSFMLTNTTGTAQTYNIGIKPAKGEGPWKPESIVLRKAYFAQDMDFDEVSDVLPLIINNQVTVPAGQSQEIWLTLQTKDIKPGLHRLNVTLTPQDEEKQAKQVQLQANIFPVRFPDQVPVSTVNWSYIYSFPKVFGGLEKEAAADLLSHYTNTIILGGGEPWVLPEVDAAGNLVKPLNFEKLDRAVKDFKGARRIAWFMGAGAAGLPPFPGAPLKYMSPEWKKAYTEWITQIIKHLKSLGLDYSQFFYYPVDETASPVVVELYKFTKSIDPNLMIFCNTPAAADNDVTKYVDIVDVSCVPNKGWAEDSLALISKKLVDTPIKEFWTYSCAAGVRGNSPYTYYRLMPWRIWSAGGNGCGFFSYTDWVDSYWSLDHVDYGVIYDARTAPSDVPRTEPFTPSRRWEAWREGIEDYTYLYLLDALIKRARTAGIDEVKVKKAENTLSRVVNEVLLGENDTYVAKDPASADRARESLLREMTFLLKGNEVLDGNTLVKHYRPILE